MNVNESPSLLRNDYTGGNGWLMVELEGTSSNRSAIGATVAVAAGGRVQSRAVLSQSSYYSHDAVRLRFGLGAATAAGSRRGALAERAHAGAGRHPGQAGLENPRSERSVTTTHTSCRRASAWSKDRGRRSSRKLLR